MEPEKGPPWQEKTSTSHQFWGSMFFPNSFSYGVFANIGSGAASRGQVPGGSGKVPGQVPNHGFWEGSGAGSESRVPGRFRGRFRTGKVPGQVPNDRFREGSGSGPGSEPRVPGRFWGRFRFTSSGKFPGQVPIHEFREVSGAGSEPRVSGQVPGDRVSQTLLGISPGLIVFFFFGGVVINPLTSLRVS